MSFRRADWTVRRGPYSKSGWGERTTRSLHLGPLNILRDSWPTHRVQYLIDPVRYRQKGTHWTIKFSWGRGGGWTEQP